MGTRVVYFQTIGSAHLYDGNLAPAVLLEDLDPGGVVDGGGGVGPEQGRKPAYTNHMAIFLLFLQLRNTNQRRKKTQYVRVYKPIQPGTLLNVQSVRVSCRSVKELKWTRDSTRNTLPQSCLLPSGNRWSTVSWSV